ncbi:MAG: major capsid protein [Microviridae sp.]|nr:MAG: major capsid protein [Microviridae sp.]
MSDFTFSQVPRAEIPRSTFNRSHGHKTTFDSGLLIPIFVDEALPGDTFKVHAHMFARLATPIFPIMDNVHLDTFFFAVPNRLLWDNWQAFCGEGDPWTTEPPTTDYEVPFIKAPVTGFEVGSIFDYMGLPVGVPNVEANSLHLRAYNLIYNEWFRDQNLITKVPVQKGDSDNQSYYSLLRRGKRHDYFTSALPWPQKGPATEVPLGGTIPINPAPYPVAKFTVYEGGSDIFSLGLDAVTAGTNPNMIGLAQGQPTTPGGELHWYQSGLIGDLSNATTVTINKLREAFQIQKLLERDARGGTRYTEILKSHFGVTSPDARLQRPEFLGGGSFPVIVNPIAQTSNTVTESPQGNLAAFAQANGASGFTKSFVEHSVIIGLICARADLSYQQGLHRMWSRRTRYDFYWPAFAHLGEQPVYNKEIYCQDPLGMGTINDAAFGYQERWAEYRYFPSKITGKFRSGISGGSLDSWHLAQEFTSLPTLSPTFILENPPIERIIAVQTEPQFLFDSHFKIECTRPLPTYSVPGFIDHF